jgi:PTS system ascorbate-specific IIA component
VSVSLLLVTHAGIGEALARTAWHILGNSRPAQVAVVEVQAGADPAALRRTLHQRIEELGGDGVLILTDMYGSSPANLATSMAGLPRVSVVTGVNLPMLVRALNYADRPLPEIVDKAVEGGLRSIFIAAPSRA